jgi:hypothetical protein
MSGVRLDNRVFRFNMVSYDITHFSVHGARFALVDAKH